MQGETPRDAGRESGQPRWFAAWTRPRQEHVAVEHLERQGFECFLPLAVNPYQRHRRGERRRAEPLFPRYLFLNAVPGEQNLSVVRSTRGMVDLVRSGQRLLEVPGGIVAGLLARRDPVSGLIELAPDRLAAGDRVRVFDGPLAGIEGVLQERRGETRALLLLELLGRTTIVTVDALQLKRAV